MSDFKIKFRGVRGSFPVANKDFMQFGGNTSCVEVCAGNNTIILDAGTGIVSAGNELMEKYISSAINIDERTPINVSILLSHIHQDHLLGLTFFKPMHVKSSQINIFGDGNKDNDLSENLSKLVFGKTFPLELADISCKYNIQNINKEYVIIINSKGQTQLTEKKSAKPKINDILIEFYKSYTHPKDGVMIYKIIYHGKTVIYATDKECYLGGDKIFNKFAKNCDLLIHDSQYTSEDYLNPVSPKQGYGHSTFDMAVDAMKKTNSKKLVFFHYDPSYKDEKLSRIKEHYVANFSNVIFAQEGLEINID